MPSWLVECASGAEVEIGNPTFLPYFMLNNVYKLIKVYVFEELIEGHQLEKQL